MTLFDSSTVSLLGLSARGYHGVLPAEREEGQLFTADVTIAIDPKRMAQAASHDDLAHTVDYAQVARAVVSVIEGEPVNLVETLAERVAQAVLAFDGVRAARVRIHKPQAPLDVAFDDVVITVDRSASDYPQAPKADPDVSMVVGQNWPSLRSGELAKSAVASSLADAPDVRLPEPADESDEPMAPSWPSLRSGEVAKSVVSTGLADAPGVGVNAGFVAAGAAAAAGALASRPEPDSSFEGAPCWPSAQSADVSGASMDDVMAHYASEDLARATDSQAAPAASGVVPAPEEEVIKPDEVVETAPPAAAVHEPAQDYYEMAPHWPSVRSGELAKSAVSAGLADAPDVRLPEPADLEEDTHGAMAPSWPSLRDGELAKSAVSAGLADAPDVRLPEPTADDDPHATMAPSWPSLRDGALAQSAVDSSMAPAPGLGVSAGAGTIAAGLAFRPEPDQSVEAAPCWPSPSSAADPAAAIERIAQGENPDQPCEVHAPEAAAGDEQEESSSGSEARPFDGQPLNEEVILPPAAPHGTHDSAPDTTVTALDERPAQPAQIVLALGGNIGDVVDTLRHAVDELSDTTGIEVLSLAPLARTAAVTLPGSPQQPDYLNTVVVALTALSPREVLDVCHRIENAAGRRRDEHWGPRTLDIDLISYDGVTSDAPELTLPHPRAAQRAFVLLPWSHVDPFAQIDGRSVAELADQAPDRDGVRWLALEWKNSEALPAKPAGHYEVGHESA